MPRCDGSAEGDPEGPRGSAASAQTIGATIDRPRRSLLLRRAHGPGIRPEGYVDRYSKRDVALLVAIFALNIADAFMTMLWLHRGGREANPIMAFFLDIGPVAFLAQKCLIVGFWLILLLVHKNFRFAKVGLYASLAVYALLLIVHFSIVAARHRSPARHGHCRPRAGGDSISLARVPATPPSRRRPSRLAKDFSLNRTRDRPAAE
jgi:hypothetical protein